MNIRPLYFSFVSAAAVLMSSCASSTVSGSSDGATVPAPTVVNIDRLPLAKPDPNGRKNLVISPYRPYNLIDVKGYRSGSVAGDPSTARLDPKTGKPIASTAKMFRLP